MAFMETKRGDNEARNAKIAAKKDRNMLKKLEELSKHYPGNKYEIREKGGVKTVVRISGKRPHKTSKKAKV